MVQKVLQNLKHQIRLLRLPKLLLLNNVALDDPHKQAVLKAVAIEQQWFSTVPPFESLAQIIAAHGSGRLAKVIGNQNYQPIMRLRNPKLAETYPAYLATPTKDLLDEIGLRWREAADQHAINPRIKLAITSLVRTRSYQDTLVAAGKLAAPDSPHTRGEAFDVDASGYYIGDVAVNARRPVHDSFHKAFQDLQAELPKPEYADYDQYNPAVHDILQTILDQMSAEGKLHYVIEYPETTNRVFHVCRQPNNQP